MAKKRFPLVLVDWIDAAQPVAAWCYVDDLPDPAPVRIQSVGFLVHDGKDTKMLAPNMGEVGTAGEQASGIIRIPASAVKKVRKLR